MQPSGRSRETITLLALSALTGLLLFVSDHPLHAWPLQAVALLPWLWALVRSCRSSLAAAGAGAVLGLACNLPLAVFLQFPLQLAAGLGAYLVLYWAVLSAGVHRALRWPGVLGALGAAAAAALLQWLDFSLLPVWGTAQSFVRVLTAAPRVVQVASLAGVTGVVFVVVALQALLVKMAAAREGRAALVLLLVLLLGAVAMYSVLAWNKRPLRTLKVAAMGWTWQDLERGNETPPDRLLLHHYRPLLEQAARRGARLVVSPEVGFVLSAANRGPVLDRLGDLARRHRLTLAVGYFDKKRNDNRIAFFGPDGRLTIEYVKTHLIPLVERYRAGKGEVALLGLDGLLLGGLICQDDNFTDLARTYGQWGAHLLAVPTNDWKQVKDHHLQNSIYRSIENRFGMVRAASNGISAIVSPRGEVLARMDHFSHGPGVIVADLPLLAGNTFYTRVGEWIPAASLALLLLGLGLSWRQRRATRPGL